MASYWDEDLAILSAENVAFSVETAGLGSRFAAITIDTTIRLVIMLLVMLAWLGFTSYVWSPHFPNLLDNMATAVGLVLFFLLWYGYFFLWEWLGEGQTPGKRYFGLRVMMADGMPVTLWPALVRNIVRFVDFLPVCYGVGALISLTNPLNQRTGDLAAGTIVSRERNREKRRPPLTINEAVERFLKATTTVPGTAVPMAVSSDEIMLEAPVTIDAEAAALALKISRQDYELARDFLERRASLSALSRQRLGRVLVERLAVDLKVSPPPDGETWLESLTALLAKQYSQ